MADDGHKICPDTQASNVSAIFTATGVAWYYILDTVNQRFKLPRTQYGFTGLRDTVEKYVEAGLPNITGKIKVHQNQIQTPTGAFGIETGTVYTHYSASATGAENITFNAQGSNSIYGNSTTVQPPATQMYLYFYVGNFTQTAIENTAGLNASLFNGKADLDFGNTTMIDYVVEKQEPTALNNYTWYRKYADGWVEQGGHYAGDGVYDGPVTVSLPITMQSSGYNAQKTNNWMLNQPNANYIKLAPNAPFAGHLIAPNADVETEETQLAGCMIVNSLYAEGGSEAHFYPLTATATYEVPEYNDLTESEKTTLGAMRLKRLLGGSASTIETTVLGDETEFRKEEAKLNEILDKEQNKTSNNTIAPIIDILQNPLTKRSVLIIGSILTIISVTIYFTFKKKA